MTGFFRLVVLPFSFVVAQDPHVILSNGGVNGKLRTTANGAVSHVFLGIPFAEPPVGHLRFADPKPKSPWVGNLSAHEYSAACYQNSSVFHTHDPLSEDCLYLNVFTSPQCMSDKDCPVLFYCHGGANEIGSTRNFPEEVLIDNYVSQGIVVVTNNYRMGVLGFWNTGNLDGSGNFAIKDILLSLNWTQKNIGKFGGDPTQVTMMGYSSSAILTSSLTLSPRSDGLFHRAILISGTNFVPDTFNCSQERNRFLAETSGCDSEGVWGTPNAVSLLPCLRNISIEQLNEIYVRPDPSLAAKFFFPEDYRRYFDSGEPTPTYDGPNGIFPRSLEELRAERRPVPLFVGTTSREYSFDSTFNSTESNVTDRCKEAVRMGNYQNPAHVVKACVKRYITNAMNNATGLPSDSIHSAMDLAALAVENDRIWYVPTVEEANSMSRAGAKVFLYQFEYFEPGKDGLKPSHADDLKYISGNHHKNLSSEGLQMRQIYTSLIINFVKKANPNGRKRAKKPWKPVKEGISLDYNVIDLPEPTMHSGYHLQGVIFWKFLADDVDRIASNISKPFKPGMLMDVAQIQQPSSRGSTNLNWLIGLVCGCVGSIVLVSTVVWMKKRGRKTRSQLLPPLDKNYNTFDNSI